MRQKERKKKLLDDLTHKLERGKEDASLSCLGVLKIEKENDSWFQRISGRRSLEKLAMARQWMEGYFTNPQKRARITLLAQTPKI